MPPRSIAFTVPWYVNRLGWGDATYRTKLWISCDLDLTVKEKRRTSGIGSTLIPRMRRALSLLSVLLFWTDFEINLKGDIHWWAAFSQKVNVEYQWDQCVEVSKNGDRQRVILS
jgi:hypothetical protein